MNRLKSSTNIKRWHVILFKYALGTLIKRLFMLESWKKRLILGCFDGCVILLSVLLAMVVRLEKYEFLYQIDTYVACAVAFICSISLFFVRGFYNALTRHITIDAALTIFSVAITSAFALFALIIFGNLQIPRSVPFIQAAFSVIGIASLRFFIRA